MKKKKLNKKGFTLVELVVATAILSIIGLSVTSMMTAGTNSYRRVYKRSSVFYKSQVSATQLQEALVDCDDPFALTKKDLLLGDIIRNDAGEVVDRMIYIYCFNANEERETGEIVLKTHKVDENGNIIRLDSGGNAIGEDGPDPGIPFCKSCVSISYEPSFAADGSAYAVKINMTIGKFGARYTRNDVISLRNRPVIIQDNDLDVAEQALAERLEAIV